MAIIDTRRIRVGDAGQQYVDSSLWCADQARKNQERILASLQELERLLSVLGQNGVMSALDRKKIVELAEEQATDALIALLENQTYVRDVATYMLHMSGNGEKSREAVRARQKKTDRMAGTNRPVWTGDPSGNGSR